MLCYNCMRDKGDQQVCPYCGFENTPDTATHHLAAGTVIGNRYTLGRVLGEGGFGITYIGFDSVLDILVAIKEYFPYGISHRVNTVSNTVTIGSSGDQESTFEKGKSRFLSEAKNVARFRKEPGIVTVFDFIEENNTAYIVMEYLDGIDLRNHLRKYGAISVDQALDLLMPVIKSLDKMHSSGIIHRDISPDNIMVLQDGRVKLMDFGAARDYVGDNRSMSVMLKKGYAPEEQYRSNGKQGPWTDVYGICATIYRCITGKTPIESLDRIFEDHLQRPSALGVKISPEIENVLMYGLAVRREDRCQTMAELYRLLNEARGSSAVYAAPVSAPAPAPVPTAVPVHPQNDRQNYPAQKTNLPTSTPTRSTEPVEWKPVTGVKPTPPSYPAPPQASVPPMPPVQQQQQKRKVPKVPIIIGAVAAVLVIVLVVILITDPFSSSSSKSSKSSSSSGSSDTVSSSSSQITPSSSKSSSTVSSSASSGGSVSGFTVKETSETAEIFQKTVDYVLGVIEVSDYNFDVSESSDYILSSDGTYLKESDDSYFKTELTHKDEPTYNLKSDIIVEGKTYTVGESTLKDLLDNGWTYTSNQDPPEANHNSTQLLNMQHNGNTATIFIRETGSDPEKAIIQTFFIDGPAGFDSSPADFDYYGIGPDYSLKSVYQNGTPSSIRISAGYGSGFVYFDYDTGSSPIYFEISFDYNPKTDTCAIDEIHFSDYS